MFRSPLTAIFLSAIGFVSIMNYEGYSGGAIIPVPGDVPTIGFGTTKDVKLGDKITPHEALRRAMSDISTFENAVKDCVHVPLYQYEYDAYLSLSYNIGTNAFCGSTLVKKLNSGDYLGACKEILRWNRQGGKVLPGLVKRRESEEAKCEGK